jgi:hypothetical protein
MKKKYAGNNSETSRQSIKKSSGNSFHSIIRDPAIFFAGTISLFLRFLSPPEVRLNSPHDDLLGVQTAKALMDGDWLGDWNNRIFIKPPGYSFFLSLSQLFTNSSIVIIHLLYILAVIFFLTSLLFISKEKSNRMRIFVRVIFIFFAFNPVLFATEFSRIYRISFYTVLVLGFIAVGIRLIGHLDSLYPESQSILKLKRNPILLTVFATGFLYAALVLVRIDSYWLLYPFLLVIAFTGTRHLFKSRNNRKVQRRLIQSYVLIFSIGLIGFVMPIGAVMLKNKQVHDVLQIENYFSGSFADAMKMWSSVEVEEEPIQSIPISNAKRTKVYEVSPNASKLAPFLDGPTMENMTNWKSFNCANTGICNEAGSWFTYELRDAAVAAASIKSEREFQDFFNQIAMDIKESCSSGALKCGLKPLGVGTLPIDQMNFKAVGESAIRAFASILDFSGADNVSRTETSSSPDLNQYWHSVINFKESPTNSSFSQWTTLGNTITLLKKMYSFATLAVFIFLFLIFLIKPKKFISSQYESSLLFVIPAFLLFIGGMGIFETVLGFPAGFSLYTIPGQTVFLVILSILIAGNLDKLKELKAHENVK